MHPDSRSIHRFFQGMAEVCPIDRLSHLHLIHWTVEPPSPVDLLREAGFSGAVVVARASLADALRARHPGLTLLLDDHPSARQSADHLLMELPQGREASRLAIAAALAALSPEGRLWIFGNRESGILSISKRFSGVETALCKGHLRLLCLTPESCPLPEKGQPRAPFAPQSDGFLHLELDGIRVAHKPGVFSWRTIDPATQLLLESIDTLPGAARVLDWGCGSGALGVTLARRFPAIRVTLSDDLVTATLCARRTVELNGLADRCEVITQDGLGGKLAGKVFDAIVTNPPFHRGVRTDHAATLAFLAAAASALAPGGSLWLVGNRFLDYGALMRETFAAVEEIDGDEAFTVWRGISSREKKATRPARPATRKKSRKAEPETLFTDENEDEWLEVGDGAAWMPPGRKK